MTPTPVGMRCPECSGQRTQVRTLRRASRVPRATYALIAINVLAFLGEAGQFTLSGSEIHGFLIEEGILFRGGVVVLHQYWRLLTSAFLHENILHIAFNMYLLYLLGTLLEPAIGSVRFVAIYFTALFVGSLGVLVLTGGGSLGASGAIFGLMGAAVVEMRSRGISIMQSGIGALIIVNLIFSFLVANISIGDHIGGLIGGTLAGLIFREADRRGGRHALAFGLGGCLALTAAAIAASVLMPAGGL